MKHTRLGFTLIELLIVVAIIGILAAIAVPNFLNAQVKAKVARCYSDMRSIGTALEMLRADRGVLPIDWWDDDDPWGHDRLRDVFNLVGAGPDFEARGKDAVLAVLTSPIAYITAVPSDPFQSGMPDNSNPYYYYLDNDPESPREDHDFPVYKQATAHLYGTEWLREGQWALGGIGPDQAWYANPQGRNMQEFRGVTYNASNGLTSVGDIMLTSRGAQQ